MAPHEQLYPDSEEAPLRAVPQYTPTLRDATAEELFDEITRRSLESASNELLLAELSRRFPERQ